VAAVSASGLERRLPWLGRLWQGLLSRLRSWVGAPPQGPLQFEDVPPAAPSPFPSPGPIADLGPLPEFQVGPIAGETTSTEGTCAGIHGPEPAAAAPEPAISEAPVAGSQFRRVSPLTLHHGWDSLLEPTLRTTIPHVTFVVASSLLLRKGLGVVEIHPYSASGSTTDGMAVADLRLQEKDLFWTCSACPDSRAPCLHATALMLLISRRARLHWRDVQVQEVESVAPPTPPARWDRLRHVVDPVTGQGFSAGDRIYRCGNCDTLYHFASVEHLLSRSAGECCSCEATHEFVPLDAFDGATHWGEKPETTAREAVTDPAQVEALVGTVITFEGLAELGKVTRRGRLLVRFQPLPTHLALKLVVGAQDLRRRREWRVLAGIVRSRRAVLRVTGIVVRDPRWGLQIVASEPSDVEVLM
jgi:hypothetical protein